jgi:hypothetical protein
LIAAIVVVMIFSRLGKGVKGYIKKSREEEAKQQTEQDRAIIHADAESTKEKLDSYKKD